MGRSVRKCVLRHMRTAKAQVSLRIRTVWSWPSLSAHRTIGYYRIYEWRAKARMILCACAGWSKCAFCAFSKAFEKGIVTRYIFSYWPRQAKKRRIADSDHPAHAQSILRTWQTRFKENGYTSKGNKSDIELQLNLVISNSLISNYRLSRSENLVPVLTWNYDKR